MAIFALPVVFLFYVFLLISFAAGLGLLLSIAWAKNPIVKILGVLTGLWLIFFAADNVITPPWYKTIEYHKTVPMKLLHVRDTGTYHEGPNAGARYDKERLVYAQWGDNSMFPYDRHPEMAHYSYEKLNGDWEEVPWWVVNITQRKAITGWWDMHLSPEEQAKHPNDDLSTEERKGIEEWKKTHQVPTQEEMYQRTLENCGLKK